MLPVLDVHEPDSTRSWGGLRAAMRAMRVPSAAHPDRDLQNTAEPQSSNTSRARSTMRAQRALDDIRARLAALTPVNRGRRTSAQLAELSQRLTRIESMLVDLSEQTELSIVAGQRESQDRTLQLVTATLPQIIAAQLAQQTSPLDTDAETGHGSL